jgi:beta-glucosidase
MLSLFLNYAYNFVFLDAIFSPDHAGRFPLFPFPFHLVAALAGWGPDIKALKGSADWIAMNHYYRSYVQFAKTHPAQEEEETKQPHQQAPTDMMIPLPWTGLKFRATALSNFEKNEMGWDITPSSWERLLEILWDRYQPTPIIITESGTADTTDQMRVRYLAAILSILHKSMTQDDSNNNSKKPIDIRGYLIWTLMDNFEWAEGLSSQVWVVGD